MMYQCHSSDVSDEETFVFDTSLLQEYCSPKVEATKMSINNLTHENLKAELSKMEQRLEEYENERLEMVWDGICKCGNGDVDYGNVNVEWVCGERLTLGYGEGDWISVMGMQIEILRSSVMGGSCNVFVCRRSDR